MSDTSLFMQLLLNNPAQQQNNLLEFNHFGYMWMNVNDKKIIASHTVYLLLELEPFSIFFTQDEYKKFIHPEDILKLSEAEETLLRTEHPGSVEYRIICKNGREKYITHLMQIGSSSFGRQKKIISILDDITEQKRADIILEVMNEGFFELDDDHNFRRINKNAEAFWNKNREEILGKNIWKIFPEAVDTEIYSLIFKAQKDRQSFAGDILSSFNKWLHISIAPSKEGVIVLFYDIQKEKEAEQKVAEREEEIKRINENLVRKNKELQERNAELMSLNSVTTHVLKEPLKRIYTSIEMILLNDVRTLSDNGRGHFRRLQSSVQKMGMITDDLTSFMNVSENKNNEISLISLNDILNETKERLKKIITEKKVLIHSAELPQINGYHALLIRLFQNLLQNAIKFQPKNNIPEIKISIEKIDVKNKKFIKIGFKDNGIGFDENRANELFILFSKLHSAEEYKGNGAGLAICKKIMHHHGGFIKAASEEGKCAEFCCYFPE